MQLSNDHAVQMRNDTFGVRVRIRVRARVRIHFRVRVGHYVLVLIDLFYLETARVGVRV